MIKRACNLLCITWQRHCASIAILVSPVIPVGAPKIWDQLGLVGFGEATLEDAKTWGALPIGTKVVKGDLFTHVLKSLK